MAAHASDPAQAHAPAKPGLSTLARLMGFLHTLMEYGHRLTATFQEAGDRISDSERFLHFGTTDLRLILARIKRGLLRIQAFELSLQRNPALLRQSTYDYPAPRLPSLSLPGPTPAPRRTRAEREAAENQALLARLPTVEELVEQMRRRTPGDVIVDIGRDLGIVPGHPLYAELSNLAHVHAGNTVPLTGVIVSRMRVAFALARGQQPPTLAPPPPEPAVAATGPPL